MALGGAPHSGDAAVSNLGPDVRLRHVHRPRTRLGHHSPERTLLRRRCYTLSRAVRLSEAAAPCLRACRLAKQRHAAVAKEAEALRARRTKLAHELRTLEGRCAEKLAATQRECACMCRWYGTTQACSTICAAQAARRFCASRCATLMYQRMYLLGSPSCRRWGDG